MLANNMKSDRVESIEFKEFIVHLDFNEMRIIEVKPIHMKYLTFN